MLRAAEDKPSVEIGFGTVVGGNALLGIGPDVGRT